MRGIKKIIIMWMDLYIFFEIFHKTVPFDFMVTVRKVLIHIPAYS